MTEFAGIFEILAADQNDARLASRRALVLSRDRLDARLGKFLLASRSATEFDARYNLVSDDFAGIVRVAAQEIGHDDPDSLIITLRNHYRTAGKPPWLEDDDNEEETEEPKSKKDKKNKKKEKGDKNEDSDDGGDNSLEFVAKTAAPEGNTGLAGPSPTMDKKRWTPKSVKPIDVPSDRHPTVQKDVTEIIPKNNLTGPAHDLEEVNALTTVETLPTGKGLNDAGFADNNQDMAPHTKTFGDGAQVKPVTQEALASIHMADIPPGHDLCPRCKGQGCNDCQGRGVVPTATPAPENLRTEWLPEHVTPVVRG